MFSLVLSNLLMDCSEILDFMDMNMKFCNSTGFQNSKGLPQDFIYIYQYRDQTWFCMH